MNPTHTTDNSDQSIRHAEKEVQHSLDRFETAMEHLAEKVEVPAQTLHKVQNLAKKSKQKVKQVQDVIHHTTDMIQHAFVDPMAPYVPQTRDLSGRAISQVRGNPRTFIFAAIGLVAGLTALMYLRRRNTWASRMATEVVRKSARRFLFF